MDKSNNNLLTNKFIVCIIAVICCGLWGSAFPYVKIGYELFKITNTPSQILFAGLRFTLAGIREYSEQKNFISPKKLVETCIYIKFFTDFCTIFIFLYRSLDNNRCKSILD